MSNANFNVTKHYKKFNDGDLRAFQSDVIAATEGVVSYASVQDQVSDVRVMGDAFSTACSNAASGGTTLIQTKNDKRELLLSALDTLGTALQLNAGEDLTFITKAHYQIKSVGEKSNEPLTDPSLLFVVAGVLNGTADGKVGALPKGVKTLAVEYSADNGLSWRNGTYSTGLKFTLSGLESRKEYLVRVIYHGTFQRTSNPSKPLPVFVL